MKGLIQRVKAFPKEKITYKHLGEFVRSADVNRIEFIEELPALDRNIAYSRNICCQEPLEVALLHWHPGAESAIHHHSGFYGYVLVLQGECDNIEYRYENGKLYEQAGSRGLRGGVLSEPEGVIHKLKNANPNRPMVSLHFYYPALENLKGMEIYNEEGTLAILSDKASAASFDEPPSGFLDVRENAFEFVPLKKNRQASHRIFPVIPKPGPEKISAMVSSYYAELARFYDSFDLKHQSRNAYTRAINKLIAKDLDRKTRAVLSLASGTGRRAVEIRESSGLEYEITGIDLSEEMSAEANKRGLKTMVGNLMDIQFPEREYDTVTFLYAFGHISGEKNRLDLLRKIRKSLKKGGALYFDLFNIDNKNEWGPRAMKYYESHALGNFGYDAGDVFYKKVDGSQIAYLHYFSEGEIRSLLDDSGFSVEFIKYIGYVKNPGQIVKSGDKGSMFVKAAKRG